MSHGASRRYDSVAAIRGVRSLAHKLYLPIIKKLGGAFKHEPEELMDHISHGAKELLEASLKDIDGEFVFDYHTHIVGLGTDCKHCFVHPQSYGFLSPIRRFKFNIYMNASGIKNAEYADQEYVDRLVSLLRNFSFPAKSAILAFDKHYNRDGSENLKKTEFYVPNTYVYNLSNKYPDVFVPVVSVHPYRQDAITEIEKWASKGVKMVKWLPNAMGIDPSNPIIEDYYEVLKQHEMILLSHTGDEQAVHADEDQAFGNPLLLRTPLNHEVRVIMAHCASLGTCKDLDDVAHSNISCFELFLRMMAEKRYENLLYADISSMLQYNRMPEPMRTLLERPELHVRLVNGSDYPLVAINSLIWTRDLANKGFITEEEKNHLNEIYECNPLLFEFVLKRTIRSPESKQTLSAAIFSRKLFEK